VTISGLYKKVILPTKIGYYEVDINFNLGNMKRRETVLFNDPDI